MTASAQCNNTKKITIENMTTITRSLKKDFDFNELSVENCDDDLKDFLVQNESSSVRAKTARQGIGLEILVNDPDLNVRVEVAKRGYQLDKLINDTGLIVRVFAQKSRNEGIG